jgi:polyribonucleotide nucleotidyltransferase
MDVMRQALDQAKKGRMHILDAMYNCIPEHHAEVKPHAPRMEKLIIDSEFIGAVIGPGGKIIQEIQKTTGATINITEVGKTGEVSIFSANKESLDQAVAWVNSIVAVPEVGDVYEGTVKGIKEFGAFIEFLPGKQGLLHISEIMWKRLENMDNVFQEGDKVKVKLIGVDPKTGKFKLSRKALLPRPDQNSAPQQRNNER